MLPSLILSALIALNPQPGVNLLTVHCGAYPGYRAQTYVTGFNDDGTIAGEVYASTKCPASTRYGVSRVYASWHSIIWDLNGNALATVPWDGIIPDTTFTATDGEGSVIYDMQKPSSWGPLWQAILERP